MLERLDQEGVSYQTFRWYPLGIKLDLESPGKLLENLLGYIHIQEELSMVPPLVLDPRPGEHDSGSMRLSRQQNLSDLADDGK